MVLELGGRSAQVILKYFGIDSVSLLTSIEVKEIIQARGAFYEEINLEGQDGRIVSYQGKSIISVNKSISDIGKKRFTAAHELGHFELHQDLAVTADTPYELCNWYQSGKHEKEANEFASELLMPSQLFKEVCEGKKFGPELIEFLASTFLVSKTASILKFLSTGNHPICIFCSQDSKVRWWKMSEEMETMEHDFIEGWLRYKIGVSTKFPPPPGSVAGQLMRDPRNAQNISRFQEVNKSTWFWTLEEDNPPMFEYCIYIRDYNFALSIVWED
jgi:Zn-dependent peptidase ImmA (M78 family)